MNVSYPQTSEFLAALPASLAGGIGGGLLGHGIAPQDGGGAIGGALGSGLGTLGAIGLMRFLRRRKMKGITDKYQGGAELTSKSPPSMPGPAAGLLTPFGGWHRSGQADMYEALHKNKPVQVGSASNLVQAGSHLPYIGAPLLAGSAIGQSINAPLRANKTTQDRLEEKDKAAA